MVLEIRKLFLLEFSRYSYLAAHGNCLIQAPDEEFEEYLRHLIGEKCTGDRNEVTLYSKVCHTFSSICI